MWGARLCVKPISPSPRFVLGLLKFSHGVRGLGRQWEKNRPPTARHDFCHGGRGPLGGPKNCERDLGGPCVNESTPYQPLKDKVLGPFRLGTLGPCGPQHTCGGPLFLDPPCRGEIWPQGPLGTQASPGIDRRHGAPWAHVVSAPIQSPKMKRQGLRPDICSALGPPQPRPKRRAVL